MPRSVAAIRRLLLAAVVATTLAACSTTGGGASGSASLRPGPSFSPRPTPGASGSPVTGEVPDAVMTAVTTDLAARLGTDVSGATVVKAEAVTWPDGSLGCPEKGVMYIQMVTPGYQVVLSFEGKTYDYRVAGEAASVRLCEGLRPAGS